jgi:Caenorhabditis protein of unknown function, DUF268
MRPFLRPIDGRVADINRRVGDARLAAVAQGATLAERLDQLTRELGAYATTATESNSYVGLEMRGFEATIEALAAATRTHTTEVLGQLDALDQRGYVEYLQRAADARLDQLDGTVAHVVNYANSHRGFAAQAGLWFNPAVTVELGEHTARLAGVNDRIVELPFSHAALARLEPPARILEIGAAESTFSLSAASLGYRVRALDLRPLPYSHPNLASYAGRFEDWDAGSERFDAAFLISTIEHFGLGAYGEPLGRPSADRLALERVASMLTDEGFVVLTTRYGAAGVDELERTYDAAGLAALLEGWTVLDRRTMVRRDERTWSPAGENEEVEGVVMLIARPDQSG